MERRDGQGATGVRHVQRAAARWVEGFAARSYGPGGGAKLVDGTWVAGAGAALGELGPTGAFLEPYVRLAHSVSAHVGDQSTTAVAIAAGVVRRVLDLGPRSIPAAGDALVVARRQAVASLLSLAERDPRGASLANVCDPTWADAVVGGMQQHPGMDMDIVDIVCGADGPAWHDAVLVPRPQPALRREGAVALLDAGPRKSQGTLVVRGPTSLADAYTEEAARASAWRIPLASCALVVCAASLGHVGDLLRQDGVLVWEDAPRDAMQRVAAASGARAGPTPSEAAPGVGRLERRTGREGGWWLRGAGPSHTLLVPGEGVRGPSARMDGERLLRAAGAWAEDQRSVPGGGEWQKEVARALRSAAPLVEGRGSLVVAAVADAIGSLHVQGATEGLDLYPAVRTALDGGLETARRILRLDAVIERSPSHAARLRGPGPPSHERVRAGDVPSLM